MKAFIKTGKKYLGLIAPALEAAEALIEEGKATVRVLGTTERWYGVTYQDDLPKVQQAMVCMRECGMYPENLW